MSDNIHPSEEKHSLRLCKRWLQISLPLTHTCVPIVLRICTIAFETCVCSRRCNRSATLNTFTGNCNYRRVQPALWCSGITGSGTIQASTTQGTTFARLYCSTSSNPTSTTARHQRTCGATGRLNCAAQGVATGQQIAAFRSCKAKFSLVTQCASALGLEVRFGGGTDRCRTITWSF